MCIRDRNVDNDGSASFIVPDEAVSNFARVMVAAADNIFFQVNKERFRVVEGVVATRDLAFENSISIFPNPSQGDISIQFNEANYQDTSIEIIDAQGKVHNTFDIRQASQELNLDVPAGLYFVKISNEEKLAYKKIVIAR